MNTLIVKVGSLRAGSRGHKRRVMHGVCTHGFPSRLLDVSHASLG